MNAAAMTRMQSDDHSADGGGGADVEEFEPLFDAIDHQRVGRVRRPAAGRDEDDVEHPEGVHHAQDEREKGGGQQQRQDDEPESLRPVRAVDRGGFENVGRQRLEPGEQDQRHQRRPFPGVDGDQRGERALRVGEQAARTGQAEFGAADSRACRIPD